MKYYYNYPNTTIKKLDNELKIKRDLKKRLFNKKRSIAIGLSNIQLNPLNQAPLVISFRNCYFDLMNA